MYGSILYGSALYGSTAGAVVPFYIGKSSAEFAGLPYALQMYVDAIRSETVVSSNEITFRPVYIVGRGKSELSGNSVEIDPFGFAPLGLALSKITVNANPIFYQGYFDLNASTAKFEGNSIVWNALFDVPATQSYVNGHGFEWKLYLDAIKSESAFYAKGINFLTVFYLSRSGSNFDGKPFDWLLYFDPVKAKPKVTGGIVSYIASGTAYFDLYVSEAFFKGIAIDPDYVPITAVPNLVAQRVSDGSIVSIDALNPVSIMIDITRTDGYLGNQESIAKVPVSSLPYSDSVDPEGNYRYMATYVIEGEKGGQPRFVRSQSSSPRLTFGKNRTL